MLSRTNKAWGNKDPLLLQAEKAEKRKKKKAEN
jgi:hypothetical protein